MNTGLVAHFIRAYGLHAIYVASDRQGRKPVVGTTNSFAAALRRVRRQHGPRTVIYRLYWAGDRAAAATVFRAVGGVDAGTALEVTARIERAAADHGIQLASPEVVSARAANTVEFVRQRIANMKAAGELRPVNRAYKAMRLTRKRLGLPTMPYPVYLNRYAAKMLYEVARGRSSAARR